VLLRVLVFTTDAPELSCATGDKAEEAGIDGGGGVLMLPLRVRLEKAYALPAAVRVGLLIVFRAEAASEVLERRLRRPRGALPLVCEPLRIRVWVDWTAGADAADVSAGLDGIGVVLRSVSIPSSSEHSLGVTGDGGSSQLRLKPCRALVST
jgi:hypothetical protein